MRAGCGEACEKELSRKKTEMTLFLNDSFFFHDDLKSSQTGTVAASPRASQFPCKKNPYEHSFSSLILVVLAF